MKTLKFEPIFIRRTSEQIEKKIKDSILDGTLKSGDRLPTEKEMAEQFGVSVVTLREALRTLEIFGIIEKRKGQRGGVFIADFKNESIKNSLGYFLSFKDLSAQHLYEVRKIIEPAAREAQPIIVSGRKAWEKSLNENLFYYDKPEDIRDSRGLG